MIKLVIASPFDGLPESAIVAWPYAWALVKVLQDPAVQLLNPRHLSYPADIARARSRAAYQFLYQTDGTHCLWWDNDNVPADNAAKIIRAMLDTGHDWVGAPYPRKRIHIDRAEFAASQGEPWRAHAYDYAFKIHGADGKETVPVTNGCVDVDYLSMGFTITTRAILQRMWDHYHDELWYTDVLEGEHFAGVALFQPMLCDPFPGPCFKCHERSDREKLEMMRHAPPAEPCHNCGGPRVMYREWLSEDYSACKRATVISARPKMYVISPVDHIGGHRFRGDMRGLIYGR